MTQTSQLITHNVCLEIGGFASSEQKKVTDYVRKIGSYNHPFFGTYETDSLVQRRTAAAVAARKHNNLQSTKMCRGAQ